MILNKIKLQIIDTNFDSIANLLKWINELYITDCKSPKPDYIIHSCFGHDILKYHGIRIAWLGENLQPDFNISDYAIGFGRINFGDRYMRIPLYRWYFADYDSLFDENRIIKSINGKEILNNKNKFCTAVVSNGNRGEFFDLFFKSLNQYKTIDSGGKWNNNIGGPVKEKLPFINSGKFHLAFENSATPGYVTEKILHAFVSHTIPIYWGAADVALDFNPKAFINCHDYKSITDLIEYIKFLDKDEQAYINMLQQPCFIDCKEPDWLSKETIVKWLTHIFEQPLETVYRRNQFFWGAKYQQEQFTAFYEPWKQTAIIIYKHIMKRIRK